MADRTGKDGECRCKPGRPDVTCEKGLATARGVLWGLVFSGAAWAALGVLGAMAAR